MGAFWLLFLLAAYGLLGGFIHFLNNQVLEPAGVSTTPWVRQIPLIGDFGAAAAIALAVLVLFSLMLFFFLRKPGPVHYLTETEVEMRKVTWPTWKETRGGSVAVIITVSVLLFYLLAIDALFLNAFERLFSLGQDVGGGGGSGQ